MNPMRYSLVLLDLLLCSNYVCSQLIVASNSLNNLHFVNYNSPINQPNAQLFCKNNYNGSLASIVSNDTRNTIKHLRLNTSYNDDYWIGLMRTGICIFEECRKNVGSEYWKWINGDTYNSSFELFSKFPNAQPDSWIEYCVRARSDDYDLWWDIGCNYTYNAFVCDGIRSVSPTLVPSILPTNNPSEIPSVYPTVVTMVPTLVPSQIPSKSPSILPTMFPTLVPSNIPSKYPSVIPSNNPSKVPSIEPSVVPTELPTLHPSRIPSKVPSIVPSNNPLTDPSIQPSFSPTVNPSNNPSKFPAYNPTNVPTFIPTIFSTNRTKNSKSSKDSVILAIIFSFIGIILLTIFLISYYFYNKSILSKQNTNNQIKLSQLELKKLQSLSNVTPSYLSQNKSSSNENNTQTLTNNRTTISTQTIDNENDSDNELLYAIAIDENNITPIETNNETSPKNTIGEVEIEANNSNNIINNSNEGEIIKLGNFKSWNVSDVLLWLNNEVKLPQHSDVFRQNDIDSEALIELNDQILQNVLNIKSFGHRIKILNAIKKLKSQI